MVAKGTMDMTSMKLTTAEQKALQELVEYLKRYIAKNIEYLALFGSKARGDSTHASDIDILIILRKEDRQLRREILIQAARISLNHDVNLSPRVIGAERWEQMQGFSLYQNVQREAMRLPL